MRGEGLAPNALLVRLPERLRSTQKGREVWVTAPSAGRARAGVALAPCRGNQCPTVLRTGLTMPPRKTWATIATIATIATRRPSGFVIGPRVTRAQALDFVHDIVDPAPAPRRARVARQSGRGPRSTEQTALGQPNAEPVQGRDAAVAQRAGMSVARGV